MASEYTKNYSFDLYTDNDKPNLRDQYNGAITKIDKQLHANATAISDNATAISDNATAIADETTRAKAAEQANATAIADETTRAKAAEQANATAIADEVTRAKAAEQALQTNIDAEKTRAENAEKILESKFTHKYNTVNDMIADSTLSIGDYCYTTGFHASGDGGNAYYIVTSSGSIAYTDTPYGAVIKLANGLYANLVITDTLNVLQLGAVRNDENANNAPIFSYIFNYLSTVNGGNLTINKGNYYFTSNITVTNPLYGCYIHGESLYASNDDPIGEGGTLFTYSGSGVFLTLANKCQNTIFENITINLSDNAYGIDVQVTAHKCHFNNIQINNGLGGFKFNTGTYTYLTRCFFNSSNPNAEYGFYIGYSNEFNRTEFFYISHCESDMANASHGTHLLVERMQGGLYVDNCDFANTYGTAIEINNQTNTSIAYFCFSHVNISGCGIGFDLNANTGNIGGVFIDHQRISVTFNNADNRFIYTHGGTSYNVGLHITNLYIRSRPGNVSPTYLCVFSNTSPSSDIDLTNGENFNIPCQYNSIIRTLKDYRIWYTAQFTTAKTGDIAIPLSSLNVMEWNVSGRTMMGVLDAIPKGAFISVTVKDGIPYANVRIPEAITGKANLVMSDKIAYISYNI